MLNKRLDIDSVIGRLSDGMTIGIGGWATRRKPMALVRALVRSSLKDLTVVSYGGPEVGMLAASGKLKKLVFGFVSLDHFPLDPYFRAARQAAALEVMELDEGMVYWGLRTAAMGMPFLPTRVGIGSDVLKNNPDIKLVTSPYADGEEFVAMPPLKLDAALIHVHAADQRGNCIVKSPDPFFDEIMSRAAKQVFVSAEKIVSTEELNIPENTRFTPFERSLVTGIVEAPFGAHPTGSSPDYGIDMGHLKEYAGGGTPEAWAAYRQKYVDLKDHAAYIAAVGGKEHISALPAPIY